MSKKIIKILFIGLMIIVNFLLSLSAYAYVMGSNNYRIEKDSINISGVEGAASANYQISDTMGEIGAGEISSANYLIKGGYRQMEEAYLAITAPSNINLGPDIPATGGTASGNGNWTVKTDVGAGYYLTIRASTDPAMQSGASSFADYTPTNPGTPDYAWSLGSAISEFGYAPYNSASQASKFKNNGSNCSAGASITDGACWYGLSTSAERIVNRNSRTGINGETTKVNFQAEVESAQTAGDYSATIIVTAVSN